MATVQAKAAVTDELSNLIINNPNKMMEAWSIASIKFGIKLARDHIQWLEKLHTTDSGARASAPTPEEFARAYDRAVLIDSYLLPAVELLIQLRPNDSTLAQARRLLGVASTTTLSGFSKAKPQTLKKLIAAGELISALKFSSPIFHEYVSKVNSNFAKWQITRADKSYFDQNPFIFDHYVDQKGLVVDAELNPDFVDNRKSKDLPMAKEVNREITVNTLFKNAAQRHLFGDFMGALRSCSIAVLKSFSKGHHSALDLKVDTMFSNIKLCGQIRLDFEKSISDDEKVLKQFEKLKDGNRNFGIISLENSCSDCLIETIDAQQKLKKHSYLDIYHKKSFLSEGKTWIDYDRLGRIENNDVIDQIFELNKILVAAKVVSKSRLKQYVPYSVDSADDIPFGKFFRTEMLRKGVFLEPVLTHYGRTLVANALSYEVAHRIANKIIERTRAGRPKMIDSGPSDPEDWPSEFQDWHILEPDSNEELALALKYSDRISVDEWCGALTWKQYKFLVEIARDHASDIELELDQQLERELRQQLRGDFIGEWSSWRASLNSYFIISDGEISVLDYIESEVEDDFWHYSWPIKVDGGRRRGALLKYLHGHILEKFQNSQADECKSLNNWPDAEARSVRNRIMELISFIDQTVGFREAAMRRKQIVDEMRKRLENCGRCHDQYRDIDGVVAIRNMISWTGVNSNKVGVAESFGGLELLIRRPHEGNDHFSERFELIDDRAYFLIGVNWLRHDKIGFPEE